MVTSTQPELKEVVCDLIIDYLKLGYTEKGILKELKAVVYWEQRNRGLIR